MNDMIHNAMETKGAILNYVVIFDSSVIYGKPIRREVVSLIDSCKKNDRLCVKFFVPEVVIGESKKHYMDDYSESKEKYNAANKSVSELIKNHKPPDLTQDAEKLEKVVAEAF